jgi:hypothetical protein
MTGAPPQILGKAAAVRRFFPAQYLVLSGAKPAAGPATKSIK